MPLKWQSTEQLYYERVMWAAYTLSHIKRTLVYKNYKFQQVSMRHD